MAEAVQTPRYDVAIVGLGPVGAIFANLLSNYGLKIAVVERAAGVYDKPRAITLDHEALRVFQACGLADVMENVAIIVEDEAVGRSLFGLYEGVPLTNRGPMVYSGVLPDRITLYQTAICRYCNSEEDVKEQVQKTVIHEVAHHFGISDPRLEELGWA